MTFDLHLGLLSTSGWQAGVTTVPHEGMQKRQQILPSMWELDAVGSFRINKCIQFQHKRWRFAG